MLQLKRLQQIILRAVFNGHRHPASEAIQILSIHFDEGPPHDGRQLLDFFPEKDRVSFYHTLLLLAHFKTAILSGGILGQSLARISSVSLSYIKLSSTDKSA